MSKDKPFENRKYQDYIIQHINEYTLNKKNVILELDCGMGKRVITYRLITEVFPDNKIIVFLQSQSSLQETYRYLTSVYGLSNKIIMLRSGMSSLQRKSAIENYRVILAMPTSFYNTTKKYPALYNKIDVVIINEVDTIIRRLSSSNTLKAPWYKLMNLLSGSVIIGMSGTLRDNHTIIDDDQLFIRQELRTLTEFIPDSVLITITDFIDTDYSKYVKDSELTLVAVQDKVTVDIINDVSNQLEQIRDTIIMYASKDDPTLESKLRKNFFRELPFIDIDDDIAQRYSSLLLLRKYLYSMPPQAYSRHLKRFNVEGYSDAKELIMCGKEKTVLDITNNYDKSVVICSFLSTVYSLEKKLKSLHYSTYILEGKVKNKDLVVKQFKDSDQKAVLIMSSVGERDLDIPEADALIIFDLINSPKTIYQKIKRTRSGEVYLLYYDNTPEKSKVESVVNKILKRYHWSISLK